MFDPAILAMMEKVTWDIHPAFFDAYDSNPASRPSRIEITARRQTFVGEKLYPKGSPSADSATFFTIEEIVDKFLGNADGVITCEQAEQVVDTVLHLERLDGIGSLMSLLIGGTAAKSIPIAETGPPASA